MDEELSNRERRELKARAQRLKPLLKVGRDGLSPAFLQAVDDALAHHELVKVKFDEFKEQKKELGPQLARSVAAELIMAVGHVVVLFRRKPAPVAVVKKENRGDAETQRNKPQMDTDERR